ILPLLKKFLSPDGEAIILIKPQFEVGKKNLNKSGIVKNPQAVEDAMKNILKLIDELDFSVQGIIESPLKGKGGNTEYLLYLKNTPSKIKNTEQFIPNI
ncbi:MAG: TlyA family rRNA (cytidine-2'-O)-methyltransferase, partial [Candidatus Pacebacteria bacterium]|nr:TlyA family rRNA (cytidine-2'-O)-methyltransferase [Candidatus Paceibacterota bacterium]